jgi:hypothetical protein
MRALLPATALLVALTVVTPAAADGRDDTDWLQARLDAGGNIVLPKLSNGECYRTRGLWVSRDDTTITSDGACVVALGPGAPRFKSKPVVRPTAVFFLTHSDLFKPLPVRVTISGLRIVVPAAKRMAGVSVEAHEVTLDHLTIEGAPTTDVKIGGGAPGSGGATQRVAVHDCVFSGGGRDVISAAGATRLSIERNVLSRARAVPRGQPGAGVHIRAADRGQPTLSVRIADNTIVDNAGPGVFLDLKPVNGLPLFADGIEVSGNKILRNARKATAGMRGGIVLLGGQGNGKGRLTVRDNAVRGNRGPGILERELSLVLTSERNDLRGNTGGTVKGTHARVAPAPQGERWVPQVEAVGGARDDTKWLQERLDARGGTIFLPKLPGGQCYAARGLWVSHDDTTIDSDGACIVSLGPGEARLKSTDGDPIVSSGVFFVNRSSPKKPAPVRVSIRNLRIVVPQSVSVYGIVVAGHDVTIDHVQVEGFPKDDVLIGGRGNGNGYVGNVAVLGSTLSGAKRNAISAFGVIALRIEGNTIEGVRDSPPGQPAAGIDVEPDDRGQPTLGVQVVHNWIHDNAGPGILFELDSNSGPAMIATELEIRDNTVVRNSLAHSPPKRAGVIVAGGEDGSQGTLAFTGNVIHDNGGPGVLLTRLKLVVQASGNDIAGNEGDSG